MRLNNLSARLAVNAWLIDRGETPIAANASYEDFASELRRRRAKTLAQVPFASRADAVAYIRETARSQASRFIEGAQQ